jgi:hypothetical protein
MAESRPTNPTDILQSYRRWKEQGESLKSQAQGFLVERFHELIQEAQQVQHDLWEDFGHTVKFPANPKFAKKAKGRPATRKTAASPRPAGTSAAATAPSPASKASAAQKPSAERAPLRMTSPESARPQDHQPQPAPSQSYRPAVPIPSARTPRPAPKATRPPAEPAKTLAQLTRQVEKAKLRLEEARASGSAIKIQNAEDRLYELSDELRLLSVDA